MDDIRVAHIAPSQYESVTDLLLELHSYYVTPPTATREQVRTHLVQNLVSSSYQFLGIASNQQGDAVGFVALVTMFSIVEPGPEDRKQCLLKELYVRQASRSCGVGEKLVRWAAGFALQAGCGRMDWNVKESNSRGIEFYKSLGGEKVHDRLSFRLSRSRLEHLAKGVA